MTEETPAQRYHHIETLMHTRFNRNQEIINALKLRCGVDPWRVEVLRGRQWRLDDPTTK